MILLSGATGKTGKQLVNLIVAGKLPARALVRDPAKAAQLRARGLEVVIGDLLDDAALTRAMSGIERAFLLTANAQNQYALEKRFIDAARAAAVSHVVKLSAIGADSQSSAILKRYHGQAEDYLRQSGLTHTIIQGGFFMDNLLTCAPSIARENRFFLPMGSGQAGVVDIRDVAEAAYTTLTQPGHDNQSYLVTGPELLSFDAMAGIMSAVLGREITYVDVPEDRLRAQMQGAGLSDWYITAVLQLFALNRQNQNAKITNAFTAITGKAPRSLRHFMQDHRATFSHGNSE